jgi:hypothetical protein
MSDDPTFAQRNSQRRQKEEPPPTLADLGISKTAVHVWGTFAKMMDFGTAGGNHPAADDVERRIKMRNLEQPAG